VDNNVNKQHCYARNNSHGDVSVVTGLVVFEHLLILPVWFGIHSSTDVLVYLAMASFWLEDEVRIGKL
jgi:hypothetical protein